MKVKRGVRVSVGAGEKGWTATARASAGPRSLGGKSTRATHPKFSLLAGKSEWSTGALPE